MSANEVALRLSDAELALGLKMVEAATPGPWELIGGGEYVTGVGIVVAPDDGGSSAADAEFIAFARTALPRALAELRVLRGQIADVEAALDSDELDGPEHDDGVYLDEANRIIDAVRAVIDRG